MQLYKPNETSDHSHFGSSCNCACIKACSIMNKNPYDGQEGKSSSSTGHTTPQLGSTNSSCALDTRDRNIGEPLTRYFPFDARNPKCKCRWMESKDGQWFQAFRRDKVLRSNGCKWGDECYFCHEHPKNSNKPDWYTGKTRPGKMPRLCERVQTQMSCSG